MLSTKVIKSRRKHDKQDYIDCFQTESKTCSNEFIISCHENVSTFLYKLKLRNKYCLLTRTFQPPLKLCSFSLEFKRQRSQANKVFVLEKLVMLRFQLNFKLRNFIIEGNCKYTAGSSLDSKTYHMAYKW